MISRLGNAISAIFRRTSPDPFVLAILLTAITALLVVIVPTQHSDGTPTAHTILDAVGFWQQGFWELLAFAMQMCLILVTGHALASSPPIARLIGGLAQLPRNAAQAAALIAAVAMVGGLINWGLGLIAGALIARDVGKHLHERNIPHHYPLLVAAGYLGLLVWHGGMSGSAPLKVSNEKDVAEIFAGIDVGFDTIGFNDTVFSPMNLIITGGIVLIAIALIVLLHPGADQPRKPYGDFDVPAPSAPPESKRETIPDWLETTPFLSILIAAPMLLWLADFALYNPTSTTNFPLLPEEPQYALRSLGPNQVNLFFLALGLPCHGTPRRYLRAVDDAVRGCSGIILQFPLYAGIMGMMKYSGLTAELAAFIEARSTESTLPILTFINAGIINLFVPSGGGQWAVQGPIAMQAAHDMGVSYPKMVMAVAYGDQLTNMLQPFWALPLLGIAGVKARDIVGYTAIIMMVVALWIILALFMF
ncbi:MAG: TIGR00366 family protein [Planctomycetota bacterium]